LRARNSVKRNNNGKANYETNVNNPTSANTGQIWGTRAFVANAA